ncbi:hypothetical protein PISL3812_01629 [Talaromyces islandicus]|uniref:HNH nuclease domain-containing protein n=1 Tax=Talaromyces islandicus TaxID=28573 RepID=A0A0U1LQ40_TALIS|nr:hypothetical protein PISL3812_01629 [Talaromyces islandicus]
MNKPISLNNTGGGLTEENVDIVASTLDEGKSREQSFRDGVLKRDDNRCVITGEMDLSHWEELGSPDDEDTVLVEAAHIIPFSYGSRENSRSVIYPWNSSYASMLIKTNGPPYEKAKIWEVLYRWFPSVRQVGLTAENIDAVSNGISLRDSLHIRFGAFSLAFKPTDTANVYEIKTFKNFPAKEKVLLLPKDGLVEFKQANDAQDLRLPERALLECHYSVAEILNASGLG